MKRSLTRTVLVIAILVLGIAYQAVAQTEGEWWVAKEGAQAQLSFKYSYKGSAENSYSNWSNTDDPTKLGIAGILNQQGEVTFEIVRPAGKFQCKGWMKDGKGSGHFVFSPDAQFAAELEKRGLGQPDERQSMKLAIANTSIAYVDVLKQVGYTFDLNELARAATHGVNEQYLKEMQAAGLKPDSLQELIRMHDHGVSAAYVKEMSEAGFSGLSKAEIVRMRDHGVTGEYVKALAGAGFKNLSAQEIVRMRDHGVTTEYARAVKQAYPEISAQELVRLQDHGVSTDFIRENAKGNSVQELIRMRDTGASRRYMM